MKTELLERLLESASKNKKGIKLLKNVALKVQQYECAAALREIEKANFPESEESKAAKRLGQELKTACGMVGIDITEDMCWILSQTFDGYKKKKGKFSLNESSKIYAKWVEIFDIENNPH